jgi:hypothetical protein
MMASKGNKHKYAHDTKEEAEEAPLKKQKMIGNDNGDADDSDSSSSSTDDFLSEPEEEISSDEEEMNLPAGFEEKLSIQRDYYDDGDISIDEEEQFYNDN